MLHLVRNENMKIFRKIQTWVMVSLLLFIQLMMVLVIKSMNEINIEFSWMSFINACSYLSFIIAIYSIVIASGIVASEFSAGTIKLLLIRPVSRFKILISKYAAVILFILFLLLFNITSSFMIGIAFFGTTASPIEPSFASILQNYGFLIIELIMAATFSFMISSVFRSGVLAITLSFILHFFSATVVDILSGFNYTYGKYFLYSNTDLRQYFYGNEPNFEGMSLGFSIVMLLLYFALFQLISLCVFKKRDVTI